MRHRCNCRHSFKNSSAMNLPRSTQHGSVIVVRWENSRLQWPSRSHFHLCVRGVDLVLVHCDAVNNSAPAWGWGALPRRSSRLSGCTSRRSHPRIGKERHLGEAKMGQCSPAHDHLVKGGHRSSSPPTWWFWCWMLMIWCCLNSRLSFSSNLFRNHPPELHHHQPQLVGKPTRWVSSSHYPLRFEQNQKVVEQNLHLDSSTPLLT